MDKQKLTWLLHAIGGLITSGVIFGLIEALVPAGYKAEAYSAIPVIAYLCGVKMPTPAASGK